MDTAWFKRDEWEDFYIPAPPALTLAALLPSHSFKRKDQANISMPLDQANPSLTAQVR
jgi:hypothetical protein